MEEERKTEDRRPAQNRVRRRINPLYGDIFLMLFFGFSVFLTGCMYLPKFGDGFGDYLRILTNGLFGLGAMILPPVMAFYAIDRLFIHLPRRQGRILWGICTFLCLIGLTHAITRDSALAASSFPASGDITQVYYMNGGISNGGVVGGIIGDAFYNSMGRAGAILTLFVAFLSSCVLFAGRSLIDTIRNIFGYIHYFFGSILSSVFTDATESAETQKKEYIVKAGAKQYKLKTAPSAQKPVKAAALPQPRPAIAPKPKRPWKIPVISAPRQSDEKILLAFEDFKKKAPARARREMRAQTVAVRPAANGAITVRGLVEETNGDAAQAQPAGTSQRVQPVSAPIQMNEYDRTKKRVVRPAPYSDPDADSAGETDKPGSWIDDLLQANARPYNDKDMGRPGSSVPKIYGQVIDNDVPDGGAYDGYLDPDADQDDYVFAPPGKHREALAETDRPLRSMSIPEGVSDADQYKDYRLPPIEFLNRSPGSAATESKAQILENSYKLEETLRSFRVEAKVVEVSVGPTVTRYELAPGQGVKVSSIASLSNDLALSLAASGIRIEAPIPGKSAVGIEIPNKEMQPVYLREIIEDELFKKFPSKLAFGVGKDITGNTIVADISKMPHLLIAGATGSGKSVCINTLITSLLYKSKPNEVKLLMVDPKVVELSVYNGIPQLLAPVVTDCKKASAALNWAVAEMDIRYNLFAEANVRDLKSYNAVMAERRESDVLPQIVIIIDELADLMMTAKGEIEELICRLAQKARAAGLHLIIATQRPSVDVITGLIKANIPSRLAFAVSSGTDSRTVLDMSGAEKLLGKGDMLFLPVGLNKPIRIQCGFISDHEVESIVEYLKDQSPGQQDRGMSDRVTDVNRGADGGGDLDEFYNEAVEFLISKGKASASMLQRQFRIGYNRASRLIEDLEARGIVGPEDGSKPRKVLVTMEQWRNL